MSTPNELAAALMVDHADVVTDAKRARDRVARIGNMLAQYAATITVEQLIADAQALLAAGEDIRRYERVAAHLLAAADRLTADDHPDGPRPAANVTAVCAAGRHEQCQEHGDGWPVPGSCACQCPPFGEPVGRTITNEPAPVRTSADDTGPDRTETGRMVADTGYPTAPANGPEATQ